MRHKRPKPSTLGMVSLNVDPRDHKRLRELQAALKKKIGSEPSLKKVFCWLLNIGGGVLSGRMVFTPIETFERDLAERFAAQRRALVASIDAVLSRTIPGARVSVIERNGKAVVLVTTDGDSVEDEVELDGFIENFTKKQDALAQIN